MHQSLILKQINSKVNIQSSGDRGIKISSLILFAFLCSFFPRIFGAADLPKILNFLHFPIVLIVFSVSFDKTETKHRIFYIGLMVLFFSVVASAIVNEAGIINVLLEMILISEPFLLFAAIVSSEWSKKSISIVKFVLFISVLFHILIAYYQWFIIGYTGDDIEGVFYKMGAGSHLAGAVALTAAVFFCTRHSILILYRIIAFISCFGIVIISDSKQIIAVFIIAYGMVFFVKKMSFKLFLKSITILLLCVIGIIIMGKTAYPNLLAWIIPDRLILGFSEKFSVFTIIIEQYNSILNWFFGIGPGHTIGRLGWLMSDYKHLLEPFGATSTSITSKILYVNESSWITNPKTGSSVFSLMFSWAGLWGDLGFVGLGAYIGQLFIISKYFCLTLRDRFWIITIFVFGFTFSWLEEPGYMLFLVTIMGLSWQENMIKSKSENENNLYPDTRTYFSNAHIVNT